MDRKSIYGLLIIAAIVIIFSILNMPSQEQIDAQARYNDSVTAVQDSLALLEKKITREKKSTVDTTRENLAQTILKADTTKTELTAKDSSVIDSIAKIKNESISKDRFGIFSGAAEGKQEFFTIENEYIRIQLTAKGGGISSAELKEYRSYQDYVAKRERALKLFDADSSRMALEFFDDNKRYKSDDFYFAGIVKNKTAATLTLASDDGKKKIILNYSLPKNSYNVNFTVKTEGFTSDEVRKSMELVWNMRPLSTEKLVSGERQVSSIFYKYTDESRSYLSEYSNDELNFAAPIQWVSFKTAYFSSVIISPKGFAKDASKIEVKNVNSEKYIKQYNAFLNLSPETGKADIAPIKFYFGPNDYNVLTAQGYEMENIINLGWGIFGWVNKWLVIPVFEMLEAMNLNYGIIILLLTLIVKILILPLTYKNYKSSAKMRVLKPEVAEITKKYGTEEPMKKQQATMALYRQSGVNPMAGCIPVLIQMPVLIAVFRFFPSAIQLRQQDFLWAEDLSAYDSIWNFGMSVPAYGDHMSLFTILMCVSTILFTYVNSSQMDTSSAMPGMKFMMYFFPVMMLFFFNSMASGLSYYYFVSNILSILIMWLFNKYFIDENKIKMQIEEYKKRPTKPKSRFQQRLDEVQKQRANQMNNKKK